MYGKIQTKNLQKELEKKKLDALLIANLRFGQFDPHFYYFSACNEFENSFLIIGKDFEKIIVPEFEIGRAEKESWIKNIVPSEKNVFEQIKKILKGKKVGINEKFIPVSLFRKLKKNKIKTFDFAESLRNLRIIKTKEEISRIKKACSITKKLYKKINFAKKETQIANDLRYGCEKTGAKFFDPIVAFDKNAGYAHSKPTNSLQNKVLQRAQNSKTYKKFCAVKGKNVLMVDLSAIYKNYFSDMTRTFILNRKDKELNKIYEIVKEAQNRAIEKIKPGIRASFIDKIVRDYLKKNGFKLEHGTGHGIGLEIHEGPSISANSKDILKEGMVFTVEPGIYSRGKFGVRIEDDILVTKNGCKVLSETKI